MLTDLPDNKHDMFNIILQDNVSLSLQSKRGVSSADHPHPHLTDETLVCKNANVATDEERINDSLVEKLKFGQDIKAEFLVFFYAEGWGRHGA